MEQEQIEKLSKLLSNKNSTGKQKMGAIEKLASSRDNKAIGPLLKLINSNSQPKNIRAFAVINLPILLKNCQPAQKELKKIKSTLLALLSSKNLSKDNFIRPNAADALYEILGDGALPILSKYCGKNETNQILKENMAYFLRRSKSPLALQMLDKIISSTPKGSMAAITAQKSKNKVKIRLDLQKGKKPIRQGEIPKQTMQKLKR